MNEIKEKKTLKKEVKHTQLYDITKQSKDIDEINREMCNIIILNTTRTINKKRKQQSINNVKKKVREESTRNNHVLFSFFRFEEKRTKPVNITQKHK